MAFNARTPMCFFMALFFIVSVKSQNILSDSAGLEGEELTLTCDILRAVEVSPLNLYGVRSLIVSKLDPGTSTFQPQVVYSPPVGSYPILQNEMDNKYYTVVAQGLDPNNPNGYAGNQDDMRITVTFTSLRCVDRGIYKCMAEYSLEIGSYLMTQSSERTQNLTIDVLPSLISATSSPFESLGYDNNENVTFRCRFQGPTGMQLQWWYKQCQDDSSFFPPTEQPWPFENDIETITNPQDSQACATIEMDSELKNVQLNRLGIVGDPTAMLCWVQCKAGIMDNSRFKELLQWNMTIDYKDEDDGQTGQSNEPDNTNTNVGEIVGPIVGSIVGVLVLIVVVALLVYFCWYRKRAKEEKYQEEDKPNTEYTLPSAPPVFHSKPEKEKNKDNTVIGVHNDVLDTSYDSKDSNRPARYANSSEMNDGPPRYERNSRGRHNKAYDEEEGVDGRRRDDPRDRYDDHRERDRPYRRRDDDAPRSRNYSTEDGTDVAYNYGGDPNMGTAI